MNRTRRCLVIKSDTKLTEDFARVYVFDIEGRKSFLFLEDILLWLNINITF